MMSWIQILVLAGAALQASCGPAPSPDQADDLERLVRKLGESDLFVREWAERELKGRDAEAEGVLRRHQDSANLGTRFAARRLLDRLEWNRNPPIVFLSRGDPPTRIYRIDPRGLEPELIVGRANDWGSLVWQHRWSFRAELLSFYSRSEDGGVMAWDARTGEVKRLSAYFMDSNEDCAWSPVENTLAFLSKTAPKGEDLENGTVRHIVVLRAASGGIRRITQGEVDHRYLCWSPDGERLAYVAEDLKSGRWDLFLIPPAGGNPEPLTSDGAGKSGPQWSPTGDRIVFSWAQGEDTVVLAVIDVGKKEPRRLTSKGRQEGHARWSPDGKSIVFISVRKERSAELDAHDLFVIDSDGKNERQLTEGAGDKIHPSWSPDGRRIAFQWEKDDHSEIYVVNVDGTGLTQLTRTEDGAFEPIWAPFR